MVRFAFCCIVFSILGAIASADTLADMIASRTKSSSSGSEPAYDYVKNTIPEIKTRNDLPASVDQSIEQRRNDLRAHGAPLYPHGLPSIFDDIDLENGPTAFDDLSSILGLPKPEPKPIKKILSQRRMESIIPQMMIWQLALLVFQARVHQKNRLKVIKLM